jgi:hypothetical protein
MVSRNILRTSYILRSVNKENLFALFFRLALVSPMTVGAKLLLQIKRSAMIAPLAIRIIAPGCLLQLLLNKEDPCCANKLVPYIGRLNILVVCLLT